jgi:hypothetical protein
MNALDETLDSAVASKAWNRRYAKWPRRLKDCAVGSRAAGPPCSPRGSLLLGHRPGASWFQVGVFSAAQASASSRVET